MVLDVNVRLTERSCLIQKKQRHARILMWSANVSIDTNAKAGNRMQEIDGYGIDHKDGNIDFGKLMRCTKTGELCLLPRWFIRCLISVNLEVIQTAFHWCMTSGVQILSGSCRNTEWHSVARSLCESLYFYDILPFTRGQRCSGLIRYGILYDTYSVTRGRQCNGRALTEFALSDCWWYLLATWKNNVQLFGGKTYDLV